MYYSLEQAIMRLKECIVRLKGSFVYVVNVEEQEEGLYLCSVPAGKGGGTVTKTLLVDGCGLDTLPVKLGYIKTRFGWQYCYRVPKRRWKQGLHGSNISSSDNLLCKEVFNSEAMVDCLNNRYEPISSVLEKGEGAFSRYFLIRRGGLYYRGTLVGSVGEGDKISFEEKYFYLKEQLERALI